MNDTSRELTRVVRSMCKTLKSEHGLDVPYTALRAAYLRAHGRHPHASGRSPTRVRVKAFAAAPLAQAPALPPDELDTRVRLHLVEDDIGCLQRLALDADGRYPVPEDWMFTAARLVHQQARVPSVRRYGLPPYLEDAQQFYAGFGLNAAQARSEFDDVGDDSGDTCVLEVHLARDEFEQLLLAVLRDTPGLADELAEWVGLHYRRNFDAEAPAVRAQWLARYAQLETDWRGPDVEEAEAAEAEVAATLEWVYPDEDGDQTAVTVCLATGVLQLQADARVPADITDPNVRVRVRVHPEDVDAYPVRGVRDAAGGLTWTLPDEALTALRVRVCQD
jgi:hypothetical protein